MSRELDLRVAAALGQKTPPEDEATSWELSEDGGGTWYGEEQLRYEDGSWQRATHIREWPPHYSTNIAAAWELVGALDVGFYLDRAMDGTWYALFDDDLDDGRIADAAAEAICLAFVAAKEISSD